jgi:hypothetical protein
MTTLSSDPLSGNGLYPPCEVICGSKNPSKTIAENFL